ncbi:zinc-dependent alcohol dehydrogenase [Salinicola peritrichatus]|uniref:zinc-dependent alcohol dehydrogenase n=1 Tax=Salinicola peritrichatus TaxID=1267424 RepID=UPI000DA14EA7|nr:zinc-dependent alcohol dehydrogenase [Salinicola peritrichatus]
MKALVYQGAEDVRVENVPEPKIQQDDDIVLRVTATAICGSDLHLYRGSMPATEPGDIFGHEFMGIVEEAGPAVTSVRKGDRVVVPFVIACGSCFFCQHALYAACEKTNPDAGGSLNKKSIPAPAALFGFSHMFGGIPGGQAEYVRVPQANTGPYAIPDGLDDEQVLFMSDILPTGYQAVLNAGVSQGSSVAIFGAGPVGLLSAACARMEGAERIIMVDNQAYRLDFAKQAYGVETLNFDQVDDVADTLIQMSEGHRGVDAVIDAVGYEAKGHGGQLPAMDHYEVESSDIALHQCLAAVRRGGNVSIPGVYAGAVEGFLIGDFFDKGLTMKGGQTHVHHYLPTLLEAIEAGKLEPQAIISHRMKLDQAAEGYRMFDAKEDDCRKIVLTP